MRNINIKLHLTESKEAAEILELGFALVQAFQELKRYMEESVKITNGDNLSMNDIIILHIIRIHEKPKSVNAINIIANCYDDYSIAYSIKKLLKLKLIKKTELVKNTKSIEYQITDIGIKNTNDYNDMRKRALFKAFSEENFTNFKGMTQQLRLLRQIYTNSFHNLIVFNEE